PEGRRIIAPDGVQENGQSSKYRARNIAPDGAQRNPGKRAIIKIPAPEGRRIIAPDEAQRNPGEPATSGSHANCRRPSLPTVRRASPWAMIRRPSGARIRAPLSPRFAEPHRGL